jgi:prepilin-type N-terminal cleavage/methylation domain-containing protein
MSAQKGLTLVELLVGLAVLGILVGVVFPGFQQMMARNNLATGANGLVLAISYARAEAVREGGGVVLAATDPSTATDEWGPGWQVSNSDGDLLRVFEGLANDLTADAPADITTMTFTGQGALASGVPMTIEVCLPGVSGVEVNVAATGRPDTDPLTAAECP